MITHVVLMKFKPDNRDANMKSAVAQLRAMVGRVPSLRELEVGLHGAPVARSLDLALITRFDDAAGLGAYAEDPVHQDVKRFLAGVLESSFVVDFASEEI